MRYTVTVAKLGKIVIEAKTEPEARQAILEIIQEQVTWQDDFHIVDINHYDVSPVDL